MLSHSKDKIDGVHAYISADFKIEDEGDISNYLGIKMEHYADGSIHIRQPYLYQIIINLIPGMDKSSAKPTSAVKPPLVKNEGSQPIKKYFNYRSVFLSLHFLKKSTRSKAQFTFHQYVQLGANPKLPHNQYIKFILKYLKGTAAQGLIIKSNQEEGIE